MRLMMRIQRAARVLFLAMLPLAAMTAFAQTTFTTGNAEVRAFLARSNTSVYAASYGAGLLFSSNQGASWSRLTLDGVTTDRYLTSLAANTNFVVVGADEGLWISGTGASGSFTKKLFEPVAGVAVSAGASTTVLAAVKGVGILRSTNSGVSFALANTAAVDSLDFTAIVADPTNAANFFAAALPDKNGARGGVFRSSDGGATWTAYNGIPAGTGGKNLQIFALTVSSTGTLYAGTFDLLSGGGDVYYRPSNGTGTWTATGAFFGGVVSLHTDVTTAGRVWGGGRSNGLQFGSTNSFTYAFAQTGAPNEFFTGVNAATTIPGSTAVLKALKGAGIWRATTACPCTWTRIALPTTAAADRVLSAASLGGSTVNILAGLYAGGVWRSSNSGASFTEPVVNGSTQNDFAFFSSFAQGTNPFVSIWDIAASPTNANLAYVAAGGVGMFYSNDSPAIFRWDGTHWGGVGNGTNGGAPTAAAPWFAAIESGPLTTPSSFQMYGVSLKRGDDTTVYASGLFPNGVYRRNGAASWSQLVLNASYITDIRNVITSPSNASKLLALSFDDKPQISTDGGNSWNAVTISQTGFERIRFYYAAEDPVVSTRWVAATNKGLFTSSNGASSWTRITMNGVFQQQAISAVGYKPGTSMAFAADWAGNRYCSNNGGAWSLLGNIRAGVNAIRTIGTSLYYLTDGAGMVREDGSC